MYLTILSIAIGLIAGVGSWYAGAGWFGGLLIGLAAFIVSWILGARRLQKRLGPAMQQVQRQIQARRLELAMQTLEDMLPLGNWMPLLKGQLYAQLGILAFHGGDKDKSLGYLAKAGRRSADAQMLLASIRYRDGDTEAAIAGLHTASAFHRRAALLHNLLAWLLQKEGRDDEAMEALNKLLKKEAGNEATRENLLRLQNGKKIGMRVFGEQWYALGFERPPASMGEMRTARKGFRQPPKRRKS